MKVGSFTYNHKQCTYEEGVENYIDAEACCKSHKELLLVLGEVVPGGGVLTP